MSNEDKKKLSESIMSLEKRDLRGIYDIVRENMKTQGNNVEFDLDKLPERVLS